MNNTAQKGNIVTALLIGVVFVGLIGLSFWYFYSSSKNQQLAENKPTSQTINLPTNSINPNSTESTNSSNKSKRYVSEDVKISFNVPPSYMIEERPNSIRLKQDNNEILISKDGTLFYNTENHLKELINKNKLIINKKTQVEINNEPAIRIDLTEPKMERIYLVYFNDFIYSFSTKQQSSYQDLEVITSSVKFEN